MFSSASGVCDKWAPECRLAASRWLFAARANVHFSYPRPSRYLAAPVLLAVSLSVAVSGLGFSFDGVDVDCSRTMLGSVKARCFCLRTGRFGEVVIQGTRQIQDSKLDLTQSSSSLRRLHMGFESSIGRLPLCAPKHGMWKDRNGIGPCKTKCLTKTKSP